MLVFAIPERTDLSQELAAFLPHQHELFAVQVASGLSYRESAKRAGFHPDSGWKIIKLPHVRARVDHLLEASKNDQVGLSIIASRSWIESQIVMVVKAMEAGGTSKDQRAEAIIRLAALRQLSQLKGLIIERKQVATATLDLGKLPRPELMKQIDGYLDQVSPGVRAEIEQQLADGTDREP